MALTKVDAANIITGVLPAVNGGTGVSSFPSPGTSGNVLTSNGSAWTSAAAAAFDAGTLMLFQQTAAPTGWTKQTTHNNKALRVVSGTASSGGTSSFTTVFTDQTPTINTSGLSAGATTLSTSQIPSHNHTFSATGGNDAVPSWNAGTGGTNFGTITASTNNTGGGGSHTHSVSGSATSSSITLAVQYVDLIIASKN